MSPAIRGSGIAKEETRPVEAFHAIEAENAIQVTVAVTKDAKPGLKISGDDNLVPLVESVIRDGALILRIKENSNISTKLPLLAEVTTSDLDRALASGASNVTVKGGSKVDRFTAEASGAARLSIDGLKTPKAIASASGASQVVLSGTAESLDVDASGASQVKAGELKVDDAKVTISGASGAVLRASKSVAGDVSGASQLDLHGRPAKNSVSTSGASSVNDKG
jgi:Putative auto-transporter adhesin, head GIN domain